MLASKRQERSKIILFMVVDNVLCSIPVASTLMYFSAIHSYLNRTENKSNKPGKNSFFYLTF